MYHEIKSGRARLRIISLLKRSTQKESGFKLSKRYGLNSDQLRACSSDRKRFMFAHLYARPGPWTPTGVIEYPTMVSGSTVSTSSSRITITMGFPQSRHGASILTVLPGTSQRTASASNPHCANHFCSPSMVMRY